MVIASAVTAAATAVLAYLTYCNVRSGNEVIKATQAQARQTKRLVDRNEQLVEETRKLAAEAARNTRLTQRTVRELRLTREDSQRPDVWVWFGPGYGAYLTLEFRNVSPNRAVGLICDLAATNREGASDYEPFQALFREPDSEPSPVCLVLEPGATIGAYVDAPADVPSPWKLSLTYTDSFQEREYRATWAVFWRPETPEAAFPLGALSLGPRKLWIKTHSPPVRLGPDDPWPPMEP